MTAHDDATHDFCWDDTPVMVCTTHMRFVPCRKGMRDGGCVDSTNPGDIARVRAHQSGQS